MKILITTQAVDLDNSALAFFHDWIKEFAKSFEEVTVICLQKGRHDLPSNVKILSLGKENGERRGLAKLSYIRKFYTYLFQELNNYDEVFVHMNPEYVVLGGLFWRLAGKKVAMWYSHKAVNWRLIIAEKLVHVIFTAGSDGFRLPSKKVKIVGHGINVRRFAELPIKPSSIALNKPFRLIHVGRITPIKNCHTLIEAADILKKQTKVQFETMFIGEPVNEDDRKYKEQLSAIINEKNLKNEVMFVGKVTQEQLVDEYRKANLSVNLTPTGGLDKAVLESMSAGVPVLSSNRGFIEYFDSFWSDLIFAERDANDLAQKIIRLSNKSDLAEIGTALRKVAVERADVSVLIKKILAIMSEGK